jgi:hypothetical protein
MANAGDIIATSSRGFRNDGWIFEEGILNILYAKVIYNVSIDKQNTLARI